MVASLVIASGVGLFSRWQTTMQLRSELELLQLETGELARVRAENERLKERQISPAELESLRADHAALPRLRAELEALKPRPPAAGR